MTAAGVRADAVLLVHGAGTDRDHHTLVALDDALQPRAVVRHDLPYRRAGRHFPDRLPTLVADVVAAAAALCESTGVRPERLLLGGRSLGGRVCSVAVAEGLPAAGLLLVSYPLHPPGRPDRRRDAHLAALRVPVLAISGTRDPFGTPEELATALSTIPGPVTQQLLDGGRHELDRHDDAIIAAVSAWLRPVRRKG